ncbi:MAG: clostripain-related cysteine peptidase, partial [Thermoplasmatota archaeon]
AYTPPNQPPTAPTNPTPTLGATTIEPDSLTLTWTCSDPDGDSLTYTVYIIANDSEESTYQTATNSVNISLAYDTSYAWHVTASDGEAATMSDTWTFRTCKNVSREADDKGYRTNWTIIVYLDGDNNLDSYAQKELNEMASAGINGSVSVVILQDGREDGDSHCYTIVNGSFSETSLGEICPTWDGEVNMGSGETLEMFTDYALTRYPAEHYMLELWNHGYGWRGICKDETNNDRLTLQEIRSSLAAVSTGHQEKIDVLVYTACKMGGIETAHGLEEYVDYFVASQESMSATGLPHTEILEAAGSISSGGAMVQYIVDAVSVLYQDSQTATIAGWDLSHMTNLSISLDAFARILSNPDHISSSVISNAYEQAESFGGVGCIDLYDFAQLIEQLSGDVAIDDAARYVIDNITRLTCAEWHGSQHPDAHGVSIYFPSYYLSQYEDTSFAMNTFWDEFLQAYT